MRNSKGQFVKGCKKSDNWYKAMANRTGENHSMYRADLHTGEMVECECGCGEMIKKYGTDRRVRKYKKGHFDKILGTIGGRDHVHLALAAIKGKKLKKDDEYILPESKRERGRFRRELQREVFERDDYTCQVCNERGVELQVDHIQSWAKYPELRFRMDNCRTVCMSCHYYLTFKKKIPKGLKWGHNFSKAQNI